MKKNQKVKKSAQLKLKLKIDFVICPQCSKGPLDNSQEKINKFISEHASHINAGLRQHPRIIGKVISSGQLKNKYISISLVEEPKKIVEAVKCRWKKCKNFEKGFKDFCSKRCKKQYKKYKLKKNKEK